MTKEEILKALQDAKNNGEVILWDDILDRMIALESAGRKL